MVMFSVILAVDCIFSETVVWPSASCRLTHGIITALLISVVFLVLLFNCRMDLSPHCSNEVVFLRNASQLA